MQANHKPMTLDDPRIDSYDELDWREKAKALQERRWRMIRRAAKHGDVRPR